MSWSIKDLLLHGAPWEVLPGDRPRVDKAARRYSRDPHLSKRDRDFIARVWLPAEEPDALDALGQGDVPNESPNASPNAVSNASANASTPDPVASRFLSIIGEGDPQ